MTSKTADIYHYEATCTDERNKRVHLDIVSEKSFNSLDKNRSILEKRGYKNIMFYEVSRDRLRYLSNRKKGLSIWM